VRGIVAASPLRRREGNVDVTDVPARDVLAQILERIGKGTSAAFPDAPRVESAPAPSAIQSGGSRALPPRLLSFLHPNAAAAMLDTQRHRSAEDLAAAFVHPVREVDHPESRVVEQKCPQEIRLVP
jgi:hypothetical protein